MEDATAACQPVLKTGGSVTSGDRHLHLPPDMGIVFNGKHIGLQNQESGFESLYPCQIGLEAHTVERVTVNHMVVGSTPIWAANKVISYNGYYK